MSAWREALGGTLAEALLEQRDVRPREPVSSPGTGSPAIVAICPACRRSTTVTRGPLGPSCGRCASWLPRAELPRSRKPPALAARTSKEEATAQAAEQLLAAIPEDVTLAEYVELHHVATLAVQEAAEQDLEREDRRCRARLWRDRLGPMELE
jgi:hypothetical protein